MSPATVQPAPPETAACPQCGGPLAPGVPLGLCRSCIATAWLEGLNSPDPETTPPDETPVRFGPFELREQLGRGGMGVVFRAWEPALKRDVALKLVSSGRMASAEEFQRLRLEAEAAARLSHPNIVTIYGAGDEDGQPWLAMQFVAGGPLSASLKSFPGRPRDGAQLLAEAARGVHHAHQHGVLHRDLKPGNILIDGDGHPLVGDFGLARLNDDAGVTMTGHTVGSPAYMAPEAFDGEASVARDVYALGVILYQLLTGHLPFESGDHASLVRSCMQDEPERPRALRADVPRDMEVIALKCLEKNPAHRHASALALAEDLENWLSHRPIKARPVSWPVRVLKWARRRPGQAATLTATVLAAAGVGTQRWHAAALQREADRQVSESRAKALTNLFKHALESAQREIESGYLDHGRRILDDVEKVAPAGPHASPEWAWLRARCEVPGVKLVDAHKGEVTALAFSADGDTLATAGQDGLIHLWKTESLRTGAEARPLRTFDSPHRTAAVALAFLPGGKELIAARNNEPVLEHYDLQSDSGNPRAAEVEAPRGMWIQTAGLSGADGSTVISFNGRGGVPPPRPRIMANDREVTLPVDAAFIAARHDSEQILCGDFTNGLHLFAPDKDHTGAFNLLWSDKRRLYGLTALALSRSGRHVAAVHTSAAGLTHIQLLDTQDGTQLSLTEPSGTVRSLAMAGDQWLAAGGDDYVVRLWDLREPSGCYALPGHMRPVRVVEFTPQADAIISGDQGGRISLSPLPQSVVPLAGAPVAASRDLRRAAAAGYKNGLPAKELVLMDPRASLVRRMNAPGVPAALRVHEQGFEVLCQDGVIQDGVKVVPCEVAFDHPLRQTASFTLPPNTQVAALPDTSGTFLTLRAESEASITLESRRIDDGSVIGKRSLDFASFSTVQFAPGGTRAFVLDAPAGRLACLSFPDLNVQWQKVFARQPVAVAVPPDGTRLAWAAGRRAGLISADDGGDLGGEIKQPCEVVSCLAFAGPDHLMLSSFDNTFLFLSLTTREVTLERRRHPACTALLTSTDFSVWLSVDLQNRLSWQPWTASDKATSPAP